MRIRKIIGLVVVVSLLAIGLYVWAEIWIQSNACNWGIVENCSGVLL